ncbi:hypothetical protein WJR50_09980 [Catalinimonas sp. 4WD22]|uniref:hypothetical protein n=1 Tax=Catalinimonas locisalis TaxID=3133978 RepID=UPI00310132E8
MFITFAVFATLSVISLAIFLVESISHQRMLKRNYYNSENFYVGKLQPVMVTTVRGGEMQETYYCTPEQRVHYGNYQLKVEHSLFKRLVMSTQFSVN